MDIKNNSQRSRQRAIDGILYGPENRQSSGKQPLRQRFRGMSSDSPRIAHPKTDPQRLTQRAALPAPPETSTQYPEDQPIALDEVPVAPHKDTGRQKRKRQGHFFRRKLRAIRAWSWKKKALVILLTLIIIVGLAVGALAVKGYFSAKKVFKGGGSAVALQKNVAPSLLKGEGDGRINILLLGNGGEGHEGPDLTDTIMIASIDPVNHTASLLSVPRDLWVAVPHHGSMKLNAVYETGKYGYLGKQDDSNGNTDAVKAGFAATDSMLESVLGIPIHYNVLVNFQAFKQGVDAVGGITLNVPTALYDPTMAWENGGNPILAAAGTQTFNGNKALMYVRSRETTSDFARAQRQRAVIVALANKVFSLGTFSDPLKISQLFDAFGNNVVTDLSLSDVGHLYGIAKGIALDTVQSIGLTDPGHNYLTTGMIGSQSVVYPIAGLNNYGDIQSFVRNTLKDGYLAKENAIVEVLNGTATPNAATNAADVLKSYGYNVGTVGDAPTKNYTKTVIVDLAKGKKPYTAQYLKKRYNVSKVVTTLPDKSMQTQNADFVVILGQDETSSSQN